MDSERASIVNVAYSALLGFHRPFADAPGVVQCALEVGGLNASTSQVFENADCCSQYRYIRVYFYGRHLHVSRKCAIEFDHCNFSVR